MNFLLCLVLINTHERKAIAREHDGGLGRGTVYVPLDSWVYPALRRLAALGYVPDEENLAAPWTRGECLTLVNEAEDIASRRSTKLDTGVLNNEALRLISALKAEFTFDSESANAVRLESLYTRYLNISGKPLTDSYHFGQTIENDYGRPYGEGANTVSGFSTYGTWNRFSAYLRGEYQQSGSAGSLNTGVQTFISGADETPGAFGLPSSSGNRFNVLEGYVGARVSAFNITVGKESVWWGPGQESAFHFTNNAEPLYMLRIAQSIPIILPGPLRVLGRVRTQFLVGRLSGHQYPPHPWINAQKITFQLTPNLEFGFTRSAIFGGAGHPITVGSVLRSLVSSSSTGNTNYGSASDPGDRRSGFDFSWHVPGLRRYVTIYSDSLADDEPNPLDAPRRSAWGPGMYISQLPGLSKLDLRFETYSTWLYAKDHGGQFIYWNNQYHDAYTNDHNIIGSSVGRDGRAYIASSTYWLSAKDSISGSWRQTKVGSNFLPGGGTQTDLSVTAQWQVRREWLISGFCQYERYFVPILGKPQRDVAAGMKVAFYPASWIVRQ